MLLIVAALMMGAGPLAKFDMRTPESEYDTASKVGDIERCLLAADGLDLPIVYQQQDRPNDATFVWTAKGPFTAIAALRVDLHGTATGTHVKAWMPEKRIMGCAPR